MRAGSPSGRKTRGVPGSSGAADRPGARGQCPRGGEVDEEHRDASIGHPLAGGAQDGGGRVGAVDGRETERRGAGPPASPEGGRPVPRCGVPLREPGRQRGLQALDERLEVAAPAAVPVRAHRVPAEEPGDPRGQGRLASAPGTPARGRDRHRPGRGRPGRRPPRGGGAAGRRSATGRGWCRCSAPPRRMAPEAANRTSCRRDPYGEGRGASMTWVAVIAASVWMLASSMSLCSAGDLRAPAWIGR